MKTVQLGDVARIDYGCAFDSKKFNTERHGLPLVRIRDVVAGQSNTYYSGSYTDRYLVHDGDYLIGMDGQFNLASWRGGRALLNQRVCRIGDLDASVDRAYLARFLPVALKEIEDETPFVTVKHLSAKALNAITVPLPALPEQRRIATILDQADSLRAKRRQVLAHLDALTQSIFHAMFGGTAFDSVALKDAIKWHSGKFLPARAQNDGPYGVYGGNGVNGSHDVYMFEEPQLVVGRVGAYCGAVHVTTPFAWVTDNALIATVLRADLTLDYLLPALTLANLNQYAGVSGQPSISGGKIGDVRLPVPPVRLQQAFAALTEGINAQRTAVQRAVAPDEELFASLQSRAFRGEL